MAERDVQYDLAVVDDDLTDLAHESRSVLVDQLDRVKANESVRGKFVRIASYGKPAAAASASKGLRRRFGDSPVQTGWLFRHKRDDDGRYGLYARYTPDEIVDGEMVKWTAQEKAKAAAAKANKANAANTQTPREQGGNTADTEKAATAKTSAAQQKAS